VDIFFSCEVMRDTILIVLTLAPGCGPPWKKPQLPPAPTLRPHTADSPFATREGRVIVLRPSNLRFKVLKDWIDWHDQSGNNLHLTWQELDQVGHGEGDWDDEYARVCNAVLPFERCAAHVGDEGWGKDAVSYADLQVRVYDLKDPVKTVEEANKAQTADKIGRLIRGSVQDRQSDKDGWRRFDFSYERFYYDYGATAHVDIRLSQVGAHVIAFAFMYTDYQSHERTIAEMLLALGTGEKDVGR
jgi:hypothetical protein